jgi:hypothetical protein
LPIRANQPEVPCRASINTLVKGNMPENITNQQNIGPLGVKNADSILKAAGRDSNRDEIDKLAMSRGINLCYQWYCEAQFFSTNRGERDRKQYLEKVYKKAKALDVLLAKNNTWLPTGAPPSEVWNYRAPIRELLVNINRALKPSNADGATKAYHDSFKSRSPFEWLVAYYLPDVFGLLEIGPIETADDLLAQKGPYVRFVQAVLAELKIDANGKPYSTESITRALRSRFGEQPRIRRKFHERPDDDYAFWRNALLRKEMGLPPPTPPAEPQAGFYMLPRDHDLGGQNLDRKGISAQES